MTGKGSLNHNSRKFHAKNTDPNRTHWNVEYCNEDIKDVYHELFDEALKRYNDKQTRKDRKIDDYYEMSRPRQHRHLKRKNSILFLVFLDFPHFFIHSGWQDTLF